MQLKGNIRQWILYLGLSTVLLSDILISAALCVLLAKRRSNFKRYAFNHHAALTLTLETDDRADGVIRNLIMYSINTCLLTT